MGQARWNGTGVAARNHRHTGRGKGDSDIKISTADDIPHSLMAVAYESGCGPSAPSVGSVISLIVRDVGWPCWRRGE